MQPLTPVLATQGSTEESSKATTEGHSEKDEKYLGHDKTGGMDLDIGQHLLYYYDAFLAVSINQRTFVFNLSDTFNGS